MASCERPPFWAAVGCRPFMKSSGTDDRHPCLTARSIQCHCRVSGSPASAHDGRGGHFRDLGRRMRTIYTMVGLSSTGRKQGTPRLGWGERLLQISGRWTKQNTGVTGGRRTTTFGRPHRPLAHRQTTNLISVSISVLCSFRITIGLGVCELHGVRYYELLQAWTKPANCYS